MVASSHNGEVQKRVPIDHYTPSNLESFVPRRVQSTQNQRDYDDNDEYDITTNDQKTDIQPDLFATTMSSILPKLLRAYSEGSDANSPKPCGQASRLTLANLRAKLGEGPMRFAPQSKERSIRDQLDALSASERACLDHIKAKWESKKHGAGGGTHPEQHALFTDEMYLRFARCSGFSDRSALKTMKKYPRNYQYLTAAALEQSLRSKVGRSLLRIR
jgi:hypothetical protein